MKELNINENTLDGFNDYCKKSGILLSKKQRKIAESFFSVKTGGGKTTLLCLLRGYDRSADKVFNSLRLPQPTL